MVKILIRKRQRQAHYYTETLGNGVTLDMMQIPSGMFCMGTPLAEIERLCQVYGEEWFRAEHPQHLVTVPSFFMGKTPITQAQWQAICEADADLSIAKDLKPDPSSFKEDYKEINRWQRPVESVSWYDALKFCAKLSKITKRNYRLPTEAEWEYACRAAPIQNLGEQNLNSSDEKLLIEEWNQNRYQLFHFGETLSTDVANYRGTDWEYEGKTYPSNFGRGLKGTYRKQTTPVGYFKVANEFGLYDMHGNVWEWCLDSWHENYEREDVPTDGTVWNENKNHYQDILANIDELLSISSSHVIRGGSWYYLPNRCRSAYRNYYLPDVVNFNLGFRVVCASPSP